MRLSIIDRVRLLEILPAEGDITTLRIVRDMRASLSFTEEELARFGIEQKEGMITWNSDVESDVDIELGPKAKQITRDVLSAMSKAKALKIEHLRLVDLFEVPDAA